MPLAQKKIAIALSVLFATLLGGSSSVFAQSSSRAIRQRQQLQQQQVQQQQRQAALQQQQATARRAAAARQAAEQRRLAEEQKQREALKNGIAVVELFTSQGCSSCPPADAALQQIVDVAERSQVKVYALSFHVDYWNRLGWDDPYSHQDFTTRQATYAAKQRGNQVYTPQMIVNGTREFVGSDKKKAHAAISAALRKKAKSTIAIKVDDSKPGSVNVDYRIDGLKGNALNVAIVQTPPPNAVPSGENSGRTLKHANVVRAFTVIEPEQENGTVSLELPEGFSAGDGYEVVAYLQNKSSYQVVGATAAKVSVGTAKSSTEAELNRLSSRR